MGGNDKKGPEVVNAGTKGSPVKPPEGTPADPTKPKAEVKAETGKAVHGAADDVAKKTAMPGEKPAETQEAPEEELPDNKWTRYYYDLKAQVDSNPAMQGPLANMALAVLLMAAKYSHYFDLMPGKFVTRLNEDEDLKDKKFDKEKDKDKIEKIVSGKGTHDSALAALKKLQDADIKAGKKTGIEKASTRYVTNALWGVDEIDDAASLAANLVHTKKTTAEGADVCLYNLGTLEAVKAQEIITPGTILIFVPDKRRGHKIVAYATGNKDEFKYYDIEKPGDDKIQKFYLRNADSPVKSELGLMAVLVPNTAAYAAATDAPPEKPADPVKPTMETEAGKKALQKAADKAVADIEKGNQETRLLIDEYKRKPYPTNLPTLLQVAEEKEKAAQQAYDSVKSNFEEAQKKTAEIQKVKDYQSKFETILNTAKANNTEAKELANPGKK